MIVPTRAALVLVLSAIGVLACGPEAGRRDWTVQQGGDHEAGRDLIASYGCGACHVVPGVPGARGMVGPPLTRFGRRVYIAGQVPNTPRNLVRWITVPQSIEPGTAMPNLGVSETEAVNIAAYLMALR